MTDLERIQEIEKEIETLEKSYAEECARMYNEPDFDIYDKKWIKKVNKLASKYADLFLPLKEEHDELRVRENRREELVRKNKYRM